MNRYKDLLSDTFVIGIGNFMTKLIYFFLMPIYTLSLSANEFGQADLLNNLAALLLPLLTLSISEGVFRFVLDKRENPNELLSIGISIIGICSLIFALCVVCVFSYTKESYWIYFYFYFISEAFRSLFAQFARGTGKIRVFSISGIIAAFVLFASTYMLLQELLLGVNGYLLAFIIANSCSIAYLYLSVKSIQNLVWSFSVEKTKMVLLYSLPLIPNTLSWWATNVFSRYIIAYHCGIGLAGLFAAISKLPALVNIVTSVFQQSWQISSVRESEAKDRIVFYSKIFTLYSAVALIAGSIILIMIPYISRFVLQGDFYAAWIYTPLLLFSAILGCFSVYFGNFYTVSKNTKAVMITTLYGAITNVLLCIVFVPLWDIYGALIASVASFMVIVTIRYRDTYKMFPIQFNKSIIFSSLVLLFLESIAMTLDEQCGYMTAYVISGIIIILNSLLVISTLKK